MNRMSFTLFAAGLLALAGCSTAGAPQENKSAEKEPQKLTKITLSSKSARIPAGEKTDITVETTPAGISLKAADFSITGGALKVQGSKATFSAATAGSWTIKAEKDGVASNSIVIETYDDGSREEADSQDQGTEAYVPEESSPEVYAEAPVASDALSEDVPVADSSDVPAETDSSVAQNTAALPVVNLKEVLASPQNYENQKIIVEGSLPQTVIQGPDGTPQFVLYGTGADTSQKITLTGNTDFTFGGCDARIKGILKPDGNGGWTLDVISGTPTSQSSAGVSEEDMKKAGAPADSLPDSGRFQFTADNVRIRYGMDGLKSKDSGYSYKAGMSVRYTGKYQKDGYTWITYTAKSGKKCSVAVGTDKTLDYGFYAGKD